MLPKIITNTSCLIALEKIGRLDLLCKLYKEILVPLEVQEEFGKIELPCKSVVEVKEKYKKIFIENLNLGKGETAALAYALETGFGCIIDDLKAKKIAINMNIKVTGTIGILIRAQKEGHIQSAYLEVKTLKLKGFYVSNEILEKIKKK